MSFPIERGLFKFDFTDHHAVLGIPVDTDVGEVRKRYLKIARKLHPDSRKIETEAEKKLANQLLSKLVNPAYEQLSQGNREYAVRLGHVSKRLATEGAKVSFTSAAAKQLAQAGASLDYTYKSALQSLAAKQYESLDGVIDKIGEISELNLAYLMLKGGRGEGITINKPPVATGTSGGSTTKPPVTSPGGTAGPTASPLPDTQARSRVMEYVHRAEGYMAKNNFAGAVLELREALKMDQSSSSCHSLLGIAYLRQNQATMAKVHINKALQLNPKDERALKAKQYLEGLQKSSGSKPAPSGQQAPSKSSDKSGGGGLFGGLFGGKKK